MLMVDSDAVDHPAPAMEVLFWSRRQRRHCQRMDIRNWGLLLVCSFIDFGRDVLELPLPVTLVAGLTMVRDAEFIAEAVRATARFASVSLSPTQKRWSTTLTSVCESSAMRFGIE
jgi:hypothetical protein